MAEQRASAELIGVDRAAAPTSVARRFDAYYEEIRPRLYACDEAKQALHVILPPVPDGNRVLEAGHAAGQRPGVRNLSPWAPADLRPAQPGRWARRRRRPGSGPPRLMFSQQHYLPAPCGCAARRMAAGTGSAAGGLEVAATRWAPHMTLPAGSARSCGGAAQPQAGGEHQGTGGPIRWPRRCRAVDVGFLRLIPPPPASTASTWTAEKRSRRGEWSCLSLRSFVFIGLPTSLRRRLWTTTVLGALKQAIFGLTKRVDLPAGSGPRTVPGAAGREAPPPAHLQDRVEQMTAAS